MHPHRYRIFIGGGLSTAICEAFEGFTIASDGAYTTLVADLDQAALHGALLRIQALDLDLIELIQVKDAERADIQGQPRGRASRKSCCRRESGISCGNYGCFKPGVAVRVSRAGTTCALRDYVRFGVARASAGSWVAAQLARNRRASSAGEPASALKATRARPGSAVSSITS